MFEHGFRTNPDTAEYRNPCVNGSAPQGASTVVSLFAGCGGLDLGFLGGFRYLRETYKAHPFQITHAVDIEARAIETYKLNLGDHAVVGDLTKIPSADLPRARVLIGGFPCQDFSSSGPKVGFAGSRGMLYRVLVDYMTTHQPDIVVGENVPHLRGLQQGKYMETIVRDFEACGYEFEVWEIFCPDYGLSQSRRRLFFVGRRNGLPGFPVRPAPTHAGRHRPIEVALSDLESIADESVTNQSQYFVATKATSGGGQGDHTNRRGELAYCIRANAKARIQFHYSLERRLTVRECARLQSFPDEFIFPFAAMTNMSHVGNAVPPIVGHHVAGAIAEYLKQLDSGKASPRSVRAPRARQHELFTLNAAGRE